MSTDPNKQAGNVGQNQGSTTGFPGGQGGGGMGGGSMGGADPFAPFSLEGFNGSLGGSVMEGTTDFGGNTSFTGGFSQPGTIAGSDLGMAFTGGQLAPGVNVNPISDYLQGSLYSQPDIGANIGNALFPGLGKLTSTGGVGGSIGTPGMGANGEFDDPANPYQILPVPGQGPQTSFPNMQTFSGDSSLADIFGPAAASRLQQAGAFPPLPTSANPVTGLTNQGRTGVPGGGLPGEPTPPANQQFGQGRWNDLAMELGGAGQGGNFFQPPPGPDMSWLQKYEAQRAGEQPVGPVGQPASQQAPQPGAAPAPNPAKMMLQGVPTEPFQNPMTQLGQQGGQLPEGLWQGPQQPFQPQIQPGPQQLQNPFGGLNPQDAIWGLQSEGATPWHGVLPDFFNQFGAGNG